MDVVLSSTSAALGGGRRRESGGAVGEKLAVSPGARFLITVFLGSVVHSSNAKDVEEKLKFKDGGDEDFDTGTEEFII
uniref:Uncharacterized protein n=1 Tax=Oryza rufipogon TaxID=4529 RepID=A0A0E0Q0F7_ORYRU